MRGGNDADCLFCKIVRGEVPATVVRESARVLAFRDVAPQAPTHVLVVPKDPHRDAPALAKAHPQALADLVSGAAAGAAAEGLEAFRLVCNPREPAGQAGSHLITHVMVARALRRPPGAPTPPT